MNDPRLLTLLSRWEAVRRDRPDAPAIEVCDGDAALAAQMERVAKAERALLGTAPPAEETQAIPDRYEVLGELGVGGMGAVYKAHDRRLRRTVALKVIRPERMTADLRRRFETEARTVAGLSHPNIVRIHDILEWTPPGEASPVPCLSLEYVEGGTLEQAAGTVDPARTVAVLARAVAYAHERGVIHRDLKPANVLMEPDGTPKVTDFGLARQSGADRRHTADGAVLGTPSYMAPEQVEGADVGPPADVWALGLILYRLAAGRLPFQAETLSGLLHQIVHVQPPPLTGVPPAVAGACAACLDKDPAKRPTAAELARMLDAPARPGAGPSRVGLLAVAAGLVALAAVAVGMRTWKADPPPRLKSLRLSAFRVEDGQRMPLGMVSSEPGEGDLTSVPFGTPVIAHAEFTRPAHAYLIAFNANGTVQLCWPVNADRKADETVAPPIGERLKYPDRLGPTGLEIGFHLDDEPKGGLQGFAVVLSEKPLPPFKEWKVGREFGWRRMDGGRGPFVADADGVFAVTPGRGTLRGREAEIGEGPDLGPLVRALGNGATVLAVPVEAKP